MFPDKSVEKYPYDGSAIGSCSYDAERKLLHYWISEEESKKVDDCGAARFEYRYISIPNPFERGDIVRCTNKLDAIGVVETSQADWMEWKKWTREKNVKLDYYDASIIVEFPTERGGFSRDHISPIYLKKINPVVLDGDERKEILETASEMLTGQASLDVFAYVCEDYREKMRRKKEQAEEW